MGSSAVVAGWGGVGGFGLIVAVGCVVIVWVLNAIIDMWVW